MKEVIGGLHLRQLHTSPPLPFVRLCTGSEQPQRALFDMYLFPVVVSGDEDGKQQLCVVLAWPCVLPTCSTLTAAAAPLTVYASARLYWMRHPLLRSCWQNQQASHCQEQACSRWARSASHPWHASVTRLGFGSNSQGLDQYLLQHSCRLHASICRTTDKQTLLFATLATRMNGAVLFCLLLCQVCFVDLHPVPADAAALSPEGFAVLIGVLVASSHLDARSLAEAVDDVDVKTKVRTLTRRTWRLDC